MLVMACDDTASSAPDVSDAATGTAGATWAPIRALTTHAPVTEATAMRPSRPASRITRATRSAARASAYASATDTRTMAPTIRITPAVPVASSTTPAALITPDQSSTGLNGLLTVHSNATSSAGTMIATTTT